jgi:hypothetical protein
VSREVGQFKESVSEFRKSVGEVEARIAYTIGARAEKRIANQRLKVDTLELTAKAVRIDEAPEVVMGLVV